MRSVLITALAKSSTARKQRGVERLKLFVDTMGCVYEILFNIYDRDYCLPRKILIKVKLAAGRSITASGSVSVPITADSTLSV